LWNPMPQRGGGNGGGAYSAVFSGDGDMLSDTCFEAVVS
jgi:hypothetical protein